MELSSIAKRMIVTILILTLICTLGSVLYYRSLDFLPFLYGAILGSAVSIAKVILLERAIDKALNMGKRRAGGYVGIQHLLRLLISGVALFIGAVVPQISLWGVAAGILSFQLAVYMTRFTSNN